MCVASVGHLEVLLLFQVEPTRTWSAEQVNVQLRTSLSWAEERLRDLLTRGMLEIDENGRTFRLARLDASMQADLEALAVAYRVRRVAVISEIYAKPNEKLRT